MINTILIVAGIAFVIWRIERIKSDIRNDIAFIEFTRELDDSQGVIVERD